MRRGVRRRPTRQMARSRARTSGQCASMTSRWPPPGTMTSSEPAIRSAYQRPWAGGHGLSNSPYHRQGRGHDVARVHVPAGSPRQVVECRAVKAVQDHSHVVRPASRGNPRRRPDDSRRRCRPGSRRRVRRRRARRGRHMLDRRLGACSPMRRRRPPHPEDPGTCSLRGLADESSSRRRHGPMPPTTPRARTWPGSATAVARANGPPPDSPKTAYSSRPRWAAMAAVSLPVPSRLGSAIEVDPP